MTRDRISDCIAEQVGVAAPKIREQIIEDVKLGPQEQAGNRDVGRIGGTKVQRYFNGVGEWIALEGTFDLSGEDGNVESGYMVSHERESGVSESGRENEGNIGVNKGERRRETTASGDGGGSKGDKGRKTYAKQRENIRRVTVDELKRLYAVHGGRIVTVEMVDQLGDGAVIQFVNRMLGGGKNKKKMTKRAVESEQDVSDASSSEVNTDAAFGLVKKMTKLAGWSREWTKKIGEVNEEQEEEFMQGICRKLRAEVGVGAESVTEGPRTYVREQRQIEEDWRKKDGRDEETLGLTSWGVANEAVGGRSETKDRKGREKGDGKEACGRRTKEAKWWIRKNGREAERESEWQEDGSGRRGNSNGSEKRLSRRWCGSSSKGSRRGSSDGSKRRRHRSRRGSGEERKTRW